MRKVESLAQLSAEDARKELIESLVEEARTKAMGQMKQIVDEARVSANKEARKNHPPDHSTHGGRADHREHRISFQPGIRRSERTDHRP